MGWMPPLPESPAAKNDEPISAPGAATTIAPVQEVTVSEDAKPAVPEPASIASVETKPPAVEPAGAAAVQAAKSIAEPGPNISKPATETATVPTKDALVFNLRGDSWVEVKRVNGSGSESILASRLMKAGSTETIAVTEPVSVVIGNASVVDVSLRGVAIDMKNDIKGNVARITLK